MDYVPLAISSGLKYYGVSDHVFLPSVHEPFTRGDYNLLDDYIDSFKRTKKEYGNQIQMFLGFECEYSETFIDYYKSLLREKGFDYLLCGQHCGYNIDKTRYSYYWDDKAKQEEGLNKYADDIISAMKSGLFLYIAHPDMLFLGVEKVEKIHKVIIKRIIEASIEYDVPLEINIHGFLRNRNRHGRINIDYPADYFWEEVGKTNAKVVYGGDYHSPDEIGNKLNEDKLKNIIEKYHIVLSDICNIYKKYKESIQLIL